MRRELHFKFVADFKKSMAESAAEHRGAERKVAGRERRRRNAVDPVTELEEHKKHWSEHCRRSLRHSRGAATLPARIGPASVLSAFASSA
jgi:hypothetical protein